MIKQTMGSPGSTEVPAAYKAYGARRGFNPAPFHRLRQFWCGEPGRGKSEFVMNIPDCAVLDFDLGGRNIVHQSAVHFPMIDTQGQRSWVTTTGLIDKLVEDKLKGTSPFKMVAFDTVDNWFNSEVKHLTWLYNRGAKPADQYASALDKADKGATYRKLKDSIMIPLRRLADVGYGWILTSHIRKATDDDGRVILSSTLPPSVRTAIGAECEIVAQFDRRVVHPMTSKKVRGEEITVPDTSQPKTVE
ncbi:unnamed protein product, partial [marine sediment metagenome]